MRCLACGTETGLGARVLDVVRPLCGAHLDEWAMSGECARYSNAPAKAKPKEDAAHARAFMDWLTRVRAERRNSQEVTT